MTMANERVDDDYPVAILVEGMIRAVWLLIRAVARLVFLALRFPQVSAPLVAVIAADRLVGLWLPVFIGTSLLVMLLVWRVARPDSYQRRVRSRLTAIWLSMTYPRKWQRMAPRLGLAVHVRDGRQGAQECGALNRIRVSGGGVVRVRVSIPVGLTVDDYSRRAHAIASAFAVREARVSPAGPGYVWIDLHRTDVLADAVSAIPAGPGVDLDAVPIGRHEDGTAWRLTLRGTHVLVAGATGAGKGSVIWSLLNALSPAIAVGWVQVWAIDPKGGMELRPGRPLFARFEDRTPERMCELLEALVSAMDQRAASLAAQGVRKHVPSTESPHLVAIIDELATLTAFAERSTVRRIEQALGLILTKGRAVGITVLAAVQDPGKDVVGWRDLFPTRVAMRLDNPIQVDMVLGDGAREAGASADHISELTPGVAFVRVEGTRAIRRVRAAYLADPDLSELVSSFSASFPRPATADVPASDEPGDPSASGSAGGLLVAGESSHRVARRPRTPRTSTRDRSQ